MRKTINAFYFDRDELLKRARELSGEYGTAPPFPHAVMYDLIPHDVLEDVAAEFPAVRGEGGGLSDQATQRKGHYRDHGTLGPLTRQLLAELNDGPFLDFLEELTGIKGLIPDPHLSGGGLHQIERDGFLKIHADFNHLRRLNLERRLNLLVYLNTDWREEYGGYLELWSRDMARCVRRVAPEMGTCVIFNTLSDSFHGHPDPLTCPEGRTRNSLALYYYSSGPAEDGRAPHSTLWQERPGEDLGFRFRARRVIPSPLLRAWRRLRRRRGPARQGFRPE